MQASADTHGLGEELVDNFEAQLARAGVAFPEKRTDGAGAGESDDAADEDLDERSSSGDSESSSESDSDSSSSRGGGKAEARRPDMAAFIPSKRFTGSKQGYVFRKTKIGLGYHIDKNGPQLQQQQYVKEKKEKKGKKDGKSVISIGSGDSSSHASDGVGGSSITSSKGNKRTAAAADFETHGRDKHGAVGMFGREHRFHAKSKAAARQMQAEKDAEIEAKLARNKVQKATRLAKSRQLNRKNKRGQINMSAQIEHILNKLEKKG